MRHTATKELLVARWTELVNDPSLHDLPYKIELNHEGTIEMRHHFQQPYNHARLGHKITKIERVVIDNETGTVIARERIYGRDAPWYFLGLDRPLMQCPPHGLHAELPGKVLYEAVLEPAKP